MRIFKNQLRLSYSYQLLIKDGKHQLKYKYADATSTFTVTSTHATHLIEQPEFSFMHMEDLIVSFTINVI